MEVDYENLLKDYLVEARELLDMAEESILELEKDYQPEQINTLFRVIHTIKGNSAIFDFPLITGLAHSFESLLNQFRKKETKPADKEIGLFLDCIDALKEMNERKDSVSDSQVSELLSRINESLQAQDEKSVEDEKPRFGLFTPPKKNKPVVPSPAKDGDGILFKDGKVLIPKSYIAKAEQEGSSLFLIKFQQKDSEDRNCSDLMEKFSGIGMVLSHGDFGGKNGNLSNGSGNKIHYAVVMYSADKESFLKLSPVSLLSASTIFKPELKAGSIVSPPIQERSIKPLAEPEVQAKSKEVSAEHYLKIPLQLLDHMINLAGETIIVRNQLLQKIENYDDPSLLSIVRNLSQLITSSQESVMRTRLQKLESLYKRIPRLIHDLERTTGKEVELLLEGGEVELDKNIIDSITDPITHMIRNSVDHGIESPEERVSAGKPAKGKIHLSASLRGGNVILKVEDDGRGLNIESIKSKAIERGLITQEEAQRKSPEELSEFIFSPGFSTAHAVSSTSGRGVGMDVVKMNFQKAGGTVSVSSRQGIGTSVIASLPQTLSIINCQMVKTSGMLFAIPQQNISELILLDKRSVSYLEKKMVYQLRGHLLPLIKTGEILGLSSDHAEDGSDKYIVVVHTEKHKFGMLIEEIENPEEIVVKPLSKDLAKINLYTGAAILGDGNVALILDISGISKFLKLHTNVKEELRSKTIHDINDKEHYLLFSVNRQMFGLDSRSVIRIEQVDPKCFERVMDSEVIQYRDEVIELCRLDRYFNLKNEEKNIERTMILIQTSLGKKGILVQEIHNVVGEIGSFNKNEDQSSGVIGNGIVLGQTVIVIDPIVVLKKIGKDPVRQEIISE
ncbi:chemotaxis protein CheW [Leptospira licerasiae]|uniref:histidine kinase n=1 Tax=Leptospira licerasiae str. MMD4847 TaxID=1049971 RepID=A0ABN0H6Z5_9LEPT|nr:chemotaxis protein CheW [Leptospira licerasiae]EID99653.1 putative chemotaxis protein CheA [Leptospira licerasiae serovar Varillal str. VAR 010]EJZ41614.1 putative chemotaxis protein CheA [Leptospira licerasiae str. MMD4847]